MNKINISIIITLILSSVASHADDKIDRLILPEGGETKIYAPSNLLTQYKPIIVEYSATNPPKVKWEAGEARIIPYMEGYAPAITDSKEYGKIVNRFGSIKTLPRQEATGRFRTEKINGRWWIIDPDGYRHYVRGLNSFRKGSSDRNKAAWQSRYGSDEKWISDSQKEWRNFGFHTAGAFSEESGQSTYDLIRNHNRRHRNKVMTMTPCFHFLDSFSVAKSYPIHLGKREYAPALVFYDGWEEWCEEYINGKQFAPFLKDSNVLGFFSDNQINFNTRALPTIVRFIQLGDIDENDKAFLAVKEFLDSNGVSIDEARKITDATCDLNSRFAEIVASRYYEPIHKAIRKYDSKMLYLGTRLHGTVKYTDGIVRACGKYCDVISINYYGVWSPELTTAMKRWTELADKPILISEFYTKGIEDSDLNNESGNGWCVRTEMDKAIAYQHFTLALLEAPNCVGWHWFRYQDDDGMDIKGRPAANKGMYDNYYNPYVLVSSFASEVNRNVYDLIDYFDKVSHKN